MFTRVVREYIWSCMHCHVCRFSTLPTREEAEGAARPLVQVHVVGVDVADQDAVVVVVQVVPTQHVELPPHRRHDVVNSPLQHGTAGQPLVLKTEVTGGGERIRVK